MALFERRLRIPGTAWSMTAAALATAALTWLVPATASGLTYYVDPRSGNDAGAGTIQAPWRTLTRARDAIRTVNSTMSDDIVVMIRTGTIVLTETLALDERDSGHNGYAVVYQAYPGEQVAIIGGRWILPADWQTEGANWKANIGNVDTRQLFVNWNRAVRARSVDGWLTGTETASGYSGVNHDLSAWGASTDIDRIEFVDEIEWKQFRCAVRSATATTVTMRQPCFARAQLHLVETPDPDMWTMDVPRWVENAYQLLDQPGEWYHRRSSGWLYYRPRAGESIQSAVGVVPVLERLITGRGSSPDQPIHDIAFRGLVFADTTWLQPGSDGGLPVGQANFYTISDTTFYIYGRPGAAIEFTRSRNITFDGNTFKRLGGAGLSFHDGSHSNQVVDNTFTDVAGSAILVGDHVPQLTAAASEWTEDTVIENNLIDDVAVEYPSGPAIWLGFVRRTLIQSNTIANVPYSGISIGWKWDPGETEARDNVIRLNHIVDHMNYLRDGGGIYSLGNQPNNLYIHNLIENQGEFYGAIYLDQGSTNIRLQANILATNAAAALFIKGESHTITGNRYTNPAIGLGSWLTNVCFYSGPGTCGTRPSSITFSDMPVIASKTAAPEWLWRSPGRRDESLVTGTLHGDFDGDGRRDTLRIYQSPQTTAHWRVQTTARWNAQYVWQTGWGRGDRDLVGDFNGDGFDDVLLIWRNPSTNSWTWLLALATNLDGDSIADQFTRHSNALTGYGYGNAACSYDYDGDGAQEVVVETASQNLCAKLHGTVFTIANCSRSCNTCSYGDIASCGTDVGECVAGLRSCDGFSFGSCQGSVGPVAEIDNHLDNDCDGLIGCADPDLPLLHNNATFVTQQVPLEMTAGASYPVSVTLRNTGCSTWTRAAGYTLGSVNPVDNTTWGSNRIALDAAASIAPGQSGVFAFEATAPATPGAYNFQWRLLKTGVTWFGAASSNVSVTVIAPGACTDNEERSCYEGTGSAGVGPCRAGTQVCVNGSWSVCNGQVLATSEVCSDGVDNDCDGLTDRLDEDCPTADGGQHPDSGAATDANGDATAAGDADPGELPKADVTVSDDCTCASQQRGPAGILTAVVLFGAAWRRRLGN